MNTALSFSRICREVIEKDGDTVTMTNETQETPLHLAAMNEHERVVELLLSSGADRKLSYMTSAQNTQNLKTNGT